MFLVVPEVGHDCCKFFKEFTDQVFLMSIFFQQFFHYGVIFESALLNKEEEAVSMELKW